MNFIPLGAEIAPGSINFVYPLSDVISGQHEEWRDSEKTAAHSCLETSYIYLADLSIVVSVYRKL